MEIRAKEKAWQLYNTYRKLEGKWGDKVMYNYDAKQCALIAIAEIIEAIDWHEFEPPNREFEFWDEVKTEIERL